MLAPDAISEFAAYEDLLLRICAAPDADHRASMELLAPECWEKLAAVAEDKRLSGLVLRAVGRAGCAHLLPADVTHQLDAAHEWHSLYALKQMVAVKRLISVLAEGGFHPIVLKGFALAFAAYPDRALRPLRDIDLLLMPEEAVRAQAFLEAHPRYRIAPWAGSYGLDYGHQLPELQDVEFDLTIEIHHRLNARNWPQEGLLLDIVRAQAMDLPFMGLSVRVPSTVANFLHLLEHATLHHAFENGPLVLADFHFLLGHAHASGGGWNWQEVEQQADMMGLARALRLMVGVAKELGADWIPDLEGIGDDHLAAAKRAMLQTREQSEQNKLLRRLDSTGSGSSGWRAAASRAFRPNPYELAKIAGCRADQARRWLYYPLWLAQRGRRFVAASNEASLQTAGREAAMVRWLCQQAAR